MMIAQECQKVIRDPSALFADPKVNLERRADGSLILSSAIALSGYARCIGEYLEHWADAAPERPFLVERDAPGEWQTLTYAEARRRVYRIATWLLRQNLSAERPVAILSDNSVEHALMTLAAMHVGIPAASISPAYSLLSKDFAKLKANIGLLRPGVVYADDVVRFAPALAAIEGLHDARVVAGSRGGGHAGRVDFAEVLAAEDTEAVRRAFLAVSPDHIAKYLFTSGSVGAPKAVINTQRMLCASQEAKALIWPFLRETPPVVVDWLPWSHTFGANHNFNIVLMHGGTLHIDAGKPAPGLFDKTLANLREIAPTIYFNVPRGYDMLVTALRADERLRVNFFSRLQLIFYAAAALPQHLWEELHALSRATVGDDVPMVSAWGSTETSPLATDCHFQAERSGVIGVPVPGCELKLLPGAGKLEIRVRGPNVMPGYWKQPDLTASAFDEEGFYKIGDAVKFVDETRPAKGLLFNGRVAEDFKLMSGTWVNVSSVRVKGVEALAPIAQDIVVTGHDREEIGFLVFPNLAACRGLCPELAADAPVERLLEQEAVRSCVSMGLAAMLRAGTGSSTYATRALLLVEAPSIDAGEITDKGYINQGAVLRRRSALVERLYESSPAREVICLLQRFAS
jgi:feruloyl-CoA synthase